MAGIVSGQFCSYKRIRMTEYRCGVRNIQGDTKKRELLENPTKTEEISKKKNLLTEI